ncbi:helix-turn-helix transcriptional regulator [Parvibaculum sp.]|uniref:helix-turn-helix transcriptional regulator n=1 Tax=Parvibaculum sp. TaxID=2024848 RepID=UPI0034A0764B
MRRLATSLALDLLPRTGVELHAHRRHQVAIADGGCFTAIAEGAAFIVPAARAIFIPAGVPHAIRNNARTRLCGVYLAPETGASLPTCCTLLAASALLSELVRAAMALPEDYAADDASGRLAAVLVDQVVAAPRLTQGRVPIPDHPRLGTIVTGLIDNPADGRSLGDWARVAGASPRTLLRLFRAETGLGFEEWRAELRVSTAIAWLSEGRRVTDIAFDLGYESPSAFIAMFRRRTGVSPRRFAAR